MGRPSKYPLELRERAVRMVAEVRSDHDSEWAAMEHVARLLGVGSTETIRPSLISTSARLGGPPPPSMIWPLRMRISNMADSAGSTGRHAAKTGDGPGNDAEATLRPCVPKAPVSSPKTARNSVRRPADYVAAAPRE